MKKRTQATSALQSILGIPRTNLALDDEEADNALFRKMQAVEDDGPTLTIRAVLTSRGKAIPTELWPLLEAFAELNVLFDRTNHLDDAALLAFLVGYLDEPLELYDDPRSFIHVDVLGGGSEEDAQINLRYYADDEERAWWKEDFPDDVIPPHEPFPYDRDRFLPGALGVGE